MNFGNDLRVDVSELQARIPIKVVRISGRVNLSNSEQLESLAHELQRNGATDVLLDLSDVPSITSAGLRAIHLMYKLFDANREMDGAGEASTASHLKLFTPSEQVRTVLKTAGFDTYIDTFADRESAIAAF